MARTQTKTTKASRTDQKTVKRAVELREQGLGLPSIAKKLTEEGHQSAHGKEIRAQTVRQWLLRELKVGSLQAPETKVSAVPVNEVRSDD